LVRFSAFRTLDPETADLARELIDNADRQRSAFMSFVSLWMAFNGWMESVTEADTDAAMITALADNRRATDAYDNLMEVSADFRRRVATFSGMWPVLNVRDVRRKLGRDAFWSASREDLLELCRREGVKLQPLGWTEGGKPTWPQLLRTIYAVRCNLFHGTKSPHNLRDRELVLHSDRILRMFIEGTGCLNWHD
jgi:hypothetical protein